MSPVLPLIGGGHTRFQPVFAGDVADAVAKAVAGETKPGEIYEFGGPEVFTFKALMEYVFATIERRRLLVPLPFGRTVLIVPLGEIAVCTPLALPMLTDEPVGVWYVRPLGAVVGGFCNDADCAMATPVVSKSPAIPVTNSFFIIMASND